MYGLSKRLLSRNPRKVSQTFSRQGAEHTSLLQQVLSPCRAEQEQHRILGVLREEEDSTSSMGGAHTASPTHGSSSEDVTASRGLRCARRERKSAAGVGWGVVRVGG